LYCTRTCTRTCTTRESTRSSTGAKSNFPDFLRRAGNGIRKRSAYWTSRQYFRTVVSIGLPSRSRCAVQATCCYNIASLTMIFRASTAAFSQVARRSLLSSSRYVPIMIFLLFRLLHVCSYSLGWISVPNVVPCMPYATNRIQRAD
jgi:hypothetical protein